MYRSYLDPDSNYKKKCDYYEIIRNLNTDWLINNIKKLLLL